MDISAPMKYPRSINVNFRKLDKVALTKLLTHYGVAVKESQTQQELAIITAKIFESSSVKETEVVNRVADKFCYSSTDNTSSKKKQLTSRERLNAEPASVGEQVAIKVRSKSKNDSDSWILGSILAYDRKSQIYAVQDEDDVGGGRVVLSIPFVDVRRLEDTASEMKRGDHVFAVFPETTSFYPATVAKNSKAPSGSKTDSNWEVVVKFDDDEDDHGKNLARRIPARFVINKRDLLGKDYKSDNDDK